MPARPRREREAAEKVVRLMPTLRARGVPRAGEAPKPAKRGVSRERWRPAPGAAGLRMDRALTTWIQGYAPRHAPATHSTYGFDAPYVPLLMLAGAAPLVFGALSRGLAGDLGGMLSMGASGPPCSSWARRAARGTRRASANSARGTRCSGDLHLEGASRCWTWGVVGARVLLLAAQRFTAGKATGIDLWQVQDRSGSAAEATRTAMQRGRASPTGSRWRPGT